MWLRLAGGETGGTSGKLILQFQGLDGVLGRIVNDTGWEDLSKCGEGEEGDE